MRSILMLNLRQMLRSRFILFLVVACVLIQLLGLKVTTSIADALNANLFQGQLKESMISHQAAMVSLIFQCITGGFLAFCFGVFIVPYLHTGSRVALTYCQPINKWYFPAAYVVGLSIFELALVLVSLLTYGAIEGFQVIGGEFPWGRFFSVLGMELLAFSVVALLGGVLAIRVGKILAFLLLGAGWMILSLLELTVRMGQASPEEIPGWVGIVEKGLYLFPPVGKLFFNLYDIGEEPLFTFGLWIVWLAILSAAFKWVLNYPLRAARG